MGRITRLPLVTARHDAHPPPFGDLLRRFRIARGWTQEELAERAGISPRSVINCESGATQRPQRETVRLLADALDLSDEDRALLTEAVFAQRAQASTAAPATLPAPPMYLPLPLTPLLGRDAELASLTALITRDDLRLVTLVGPGGVGKTRLALAAAAAARDTYTAGVYFVSLASVRDPEVLWPAAAQALGVQPVGAQTPYDALCAWLRDRRALLVLDNFEHLLSEALTVVNLLAACPHTAVLVTSRAPLHVRGEQEFPLAPLATPTPQDAASTVAASPAVQVFAHYARAVQPEFHVTAENAATVAAICARLDGLPLALELAAARTRWFTAAQLLERLAPRLPVLVNGPRDLAPRQRTMRDTIAWSDGLLADAERQVFTRLSVFAGGATPDAVEAVCGMGAPVHADSLFQQSLLTLMPGADDAPRYVMLETVREYAWERARQSGTAAEAQRQHAEYFLAFAEEARPRLRGRERGRWRLRVSAELDNLRAALRWAQDAGDAATSLRLTHALQPYWRAQGYIREGAEWSWGALQLAASAGPDVAALRADALVSAGNLYYQLAEYERAIALAREGLALARARGDEQTIADALWLIGILGVDRGELEQARGHLEESLALFRHLDRRSSIARVLHSLANVAFMRGEYPRATALAEESLALSSGLEEDTHVAIELSMLARTHNAAGDPARALDYSRDAVALFRRMGEVSSLGTALFIYADILRALHRDAEALPLYEEGITIARDVGAARSEFWGVMGRAEALYALGDYRGAADSFAHGFAAAGRIGSKQPYAPGLEGIAILAHTLGRHEEAARLLGAATALQRSIGMPQRSEDDAVIEAAQRALGDEAFATAWEAGEVMPLDEAIAMAASFLAAIARGDETAAPPPSAIRSPQSAP